MVCQFYKWHKVDKFPGFYGLQLTCQPKGPLPMTCIYQNNGFANREEYLDSLREEYGGLVDVLTSILPPSEDFDGLVTELEDALDSGMYDELI
jgi:hypothetical protein